MISILIITLAATDLILAKFGTFGLTPFWGVFVLALVRSKLGLAWQESTMPEFRWLMALIFAIAVTAVSSLANTRYASLILTGAYLLYGLWLVSAAHQAKAENVIWALKAVLITYLISSAFAFVLIRTGQAESPLAILGKSSFDITKGYRIQALSSEPSYAAIVVATCALGLVRLQPAGKGMSIRDLRIWGGACLILLVCFQSVLGYLLILLVVSAIVGRKAQLFLLGVVLIGAVTGFTIQSTRIFDIIDGVFSGDLDYWMELDGSSYMRFGPLVYFLTLSDLTSLAFWFGHGSASSALFFGDTFGFLVSETQDKIQLGLIPAFLYDYGVVATFVLGGFVVQCCRGRYKWQAILLFVVTAFNANFNTQLFWFVLTIMALSAPIRDDDAEPGGSASSLRRAATPDVRLRSPIAIVD